MGQLPPDTSQRQQVACCQACLLPPVPSHASASTVASASRSSVHCRARRHCAAVTALPLLPGAGFMPVLALACASCEAMLPWLLLLPAATVMLTVGSF